MRRLVAVGGRFLIVGGLSTVIEVGTFNLFVYAFGMGTVWAKILSSAIALVNAYFGNREWAFKHRDRRGRVNELVWFLIVNAACTVLGAVLVWAGDAVASYLLGHVPGPILLNAINLGSIVLVVLARFVLYNRIVFRAGKKKADADASNMAD